jgi:small conductance mechanosensitive channel
VSDWFDSSTDFWEWVRETPLRVTLLLVGGWIVNWLARRAIGRFVAGLHRTALEVSERAPGTFLSASVRDERLASRTETVTSVLRSVTTAILATVVLMLVLGELGISLGPLLASAGVAGVAIGFGAQSIVRDFLSGLFMLIEDQYGVGDIIDVGDATGTVEQVGLRTTRLRDVKGTVWYVPNGEIRRVGNFSQYYAKALVDVEIAYESDVRAAISLIEETVAAFAEDEREGLDRLVDAPEVQGVQSVAAGGVAIRVVVTTKPSVQFAVERELRLRLKEAFDAAGIVLPAIQRAPWSRPGSEG